MDRHVHAKAEAEWQQALELEKKLKATTRKKSFYDPEVRGLRKQLRDTYESLLFLDAAFASANEVEAQMWRTVFYMPIEEFRTRIRKAEKESQQQGGQSAMAGSDAASIMAKTAAAFLKFLDEAALFYKRLVMQLQSAYGDVKVRLELPPNVRLVRSTADAEGMQISTCSSGARDMRNSIHRCLVFLGDLSRYASQAAPKAAAVVAAPTAASGSASAAAVTAAKAEWSKAISYYRMAAHVLPRSGNPHNQLAVMAFMTGEEMKAAYHYARSLSVHSPFTTARENLLQLLQSNRDRYTNLCKQRQQQGQAKLPLSMQQQLSELSTCYVRLCGLLYDKINQHEYGTVAKAAFEALAGFLDHPHLLQLLQRQRLYDCTPLHLVVLSIFMVHHSFDGLGAGGSSGRHHERQQQHEQGANGVGNSRPGTGEGSAAAASSGSRDSTGGLRTYAGAPSPLSPLAAAPVGTYGDAAQRSQQRSRALAMVFRTGRLLAQAATAAVNAEAAVAAGAGACNGVAAAAAAGKTGATCLLVGLNVVLQWLAAQPNCAVLQAGSATEEDVKARSKFWAAVGQLLLVLAPALRLYYEQLQQQQGEQTSAAATAASVAGLAGAGAGPVSGGGGVSGSLGGDASCEEGALPEDLELLGFEPTRSRHYWHVTDVGKHAVDETRTRIKRMLAAARVISAALAADQQQQLLSRHLSTSISPQALNQLSTAMAQFVEVVAVVASTRTPAPSPVALPGAAASGAGGLARASPGQQQQQARAGFAVAAAGAQRAGVTAMDVDTDAGQYHHQQLQQQQQQQSGLPSSTTPPAAAAGDAQPEGEEEEEEVIVFRPRVSRLSSATLDDAPVGTAAAAAVGGSSAAKPAAAGTGVAAGGGGAAAGGPHHGPGSASAGPPPLPHILLAGRQPGSSTAASPTTRSLASPQHQQHQPSLAAQHASLVHAEQPSEAARGGLLPGTAGLNGPSRDAGNSRDAAAAAAAAALSMSGGMLLQGHAATALDLQQAQAASDILLARLNARHGIAGSPAAAAAGGGTGAPGFSSGSGLTLGVMQGGGGSNLGGGTLAAQQQQQQQQQWGASLANGAAAGYQGVQQGLQPHGLQQQQQQQQGLQQAGPSEDVAMAQALLGTGLATLLGGLGDELLGPHPTAAAAVDAVGPWGSGQVRTQLRTQQYQQQQQGSAEALAAVSAAVAASMQAAGLDLPPRGGHFGGSAASAAAVSMAMGLDDPLATLGVLGIPTGALGLSVGLPGSSAGMLGGQAGGYLPNPGSFQGFGPEGFSSDAMQGLGGPMRTVSASAAAVGGGVAAGGRLVSAPVGILQQAIAEAGATPGGGFGRTSGADDGGFVQAGAAAAGGFGAQQEQLSSSYVANHHMEATAMDAANRVLSPEFQSSGMAMLQQRQQQMQQQQQQQLHNQQQLDHHQFQQQLLHNQQQVDQQQLDDHHHQQQQQLDQQQQQQGLFVAAAGGGADLSGSLHSRPGSRFSGSAGSTPRATTPKGAGGLSAALQDQQQQLQAHMQQQHQQQRRLSAGSTSPRSAVGAERGVGYASDAILDRPGAAAVFDRAGRMSVPSFSVGTTTAAAAGNGYQQRQQRSSIGAMFAGPDLFAPSEYTEQLPPMHKRVSSGGSSGPFAAFPAVSAAGGGGGGGGGGFFGRGDAAGIQDLQDLVQDPAALLPSVLGDILQDPPGSDFANGHAPSVQGVQQQQQQRVVVAGSPDQGDEGLTLVEYLAAQQRKLQQHVTWGSDSSNGLQAAAAAGADLSAHLLLPPRDFAESQNPFG